MTEKTLITTPFGFESTAAEVVAGIDLSGKRAIVTGASSGIGVERRVPWQARVPRSRSQSATPTPASGPLPTSLRPPAAPPSTSAGSISPIRRRSPPSSRAGVGRCTGSSTTRA